MCAHDTALLKNQHFCCCCHHIILQGKLEPDARQALIAKGQQLKQQLEELEEKLVQVSWVYPSYL